jgi:hypothetical protein
VLAACGRASAREAEPASVLEEPLQGGGTVADLLAPDRPTALLVYPPGYTFACAAELVRWRELEKEGRVHAVLVLDRPPNEADRKALAIRRVHVGGIISRGPGGKPPREFLVEGGAIRVTAQGTAQTGFRSPVLARVMGTADATASR